MVKDPLVPVAKRVVEEPWHFARRLAGRHGRQAARPEGLLCVAEDGVCMRSAESPSVPAMAVAGGRELDQMVIGV